SRERRIDGSKCVQGLIPTHTLLIVSMAIFSLRHPTQAQPGARAAATCPPTTTFFATHSISVGSVRRKATQTIYICVSLSSKYLFVIGDSNSTLCLSPGSLALLRLTWLRIKVVS
ncbi:hypothetical protein B0H16DRAFT_1510878, partial [Mycena metata]